MVLVNKSKSQNKVREKTTRPEADATISLRGPESVPPIFRLAQPDSYPITQFGAQTGRSQRSSEASLRCNGVGTAPPISGPPGAYERSPKLIVVHTTG